jgi:hypothetical protein
MRLVSLLPALIVGLASQGPAQDASPLPPAVQQSQGLLTAPASTGPAPEVTTITTSAPVSSSTSSSKQFIVYGADLQTRGAFCQICEGVAENLGRLLKDDGKFALPVVVVLKTPLQSSPGQPAIATSFSQLAYGGFHLQINVELRDGFSADDFSTELVRMLLAERILRNHKEVQTTRNQLLSGWLLTGVTQAMEFRSRSRPSALFAAVFRSGQVYSIDRIIEANPRELDALSRGIYETSSCALVLALLDQVDGPVRFSRFLSALANGHKEDRELLKEHFPTLGISENSLEKWWTLQMASLATPSTFEAMDYVQTEKALAEALTFRVAGTDTPSVAAKPISRPPPSMAAPAPGADAEAVSEEEKKKSRSWLWFGRKDKEKEKEAEQPEESAPADKPASADASGAVNPESNRLLRPPGIHSLTGGRKIAAPAQAAPANVDGQPSPDAAAAPETAKPSGGFFNLFRKKKAEPAPQPEPAPAEAPARSRRSAPKPETKPAATPPPPKPAPTPATPPAAESEKTGPAPAASPTGFVGPPALELAGPPKPELMGPPAPGTENESLPAVMPLPPNAEQRDPAMQAQDPDSPLGTNPLLGMPQGLPFPTEPTPAPPELPAEPEPFLPFDKPPGPDMLVLEDFGKLARRKDRSEILKRTLNQINSVKMRAHPLYRPVVGDYATVVQNLILGRESGVATDLAAIRKRHLEVREMARSVDSYVDWYEASQTPHYSHTFDDYLKLRDKLEKETLPRADAISLYLDALQKEFED